jgi:hypothetical protein
MRDFINNNVRLILYSFFIFAILGLFHPHFWFLVIPHIILSLYVWYDILIRREK